MITKSLEDHSRPPAIAGPQIQLLQQLCNACGVSGNEKEVRLIVLDQVRPIVDEVEVDALGNVLAVKKGSGKRRLRVMVTAHMDEVGMMITHDDGGGIFRFGQVGSVDPRRLAGKSVWVGPSHLPGLIGIKPVHLASSAEHRSNISLDDLRIDVGPDQAKMVELGNWATFASTFSQIGPSIRAKALDDRIGVATLIELIRAAPANIDLLAAFTVQEEVGLRGARVAAYKLDPDLALILDCTPAYDLPPYHDGGFGGPGSENIRYNTRLGGGPAIYIADRDTISDPRLIRHLIQTAEAMGIPCQLRQPGGGGTDAGAIHTQRRGIPSVSISVPGRYPHTGSMIVRLEDWIHTLALVFRSLQRLPADILESER